MLNISHQTGPTKGIGSCHFLFLSSEIYWREVGQWTGLSIKSERRISVGSNRKGPFHLTFDRNFRKFWHSGKHPLLYVCELWPPVKDIERKLVNKTRNDLWWDKTIENNLDWFLKWLKITLPDFWNDLTWSKTTLQGFLKWPLMIENNLDWFRKWP